MVRRFSTLCKKQNETVDEADLESAKRTIKDITLVGVYEQLLTHIAMLSESLRFTEPFLMHANTSKYTLVSGEFNIDEIRDLNCLDSRLYEYVIQLHADRLTTFPLAEPIAKLISENTVKLEASLLRFDVELTQLRDVKFAPD